MSTEFFAFEGADPAPAASTIPAAAPTAESEAVVIESPEAPGTWEGDISGLQARFPGTRLGTLFCVHKLEQDADLKLRDFKAEAELRGVALSGRSYHGARVLLGFETPKPRRARAAEPEAGLDAMLDESEDAFEEPAIDLPTAAMAATVGTDLESALRTAIDVAATQRTERMRDAIRRAIAVLEEALED